MSQNTKIEWADHTFNPWIGCTAISPGCTNCYASDWAKRYGKDFASRTRTKTWGDPVRWNKYAANFFFEHGRRQRVFCASLADVFDNEVPVQWRIDLMKLIAETPNLNWLILTKRIGNAAEMLETAFRAITAGREGWRDNALPNVWLGATIVNQEEADRDIPKLLAVPAAKRFLSMEPLLGAVDILKWLDPWTCANCGFHGSMSDSGPCKCADCDIETVYDESIGSDKCPQCEKDNGTSDEVGLSCPSCERSGGWERDNGFKFDSEKKLIDWVIVGGESGPNARPMHPDWARSLRDQCEAAGVAYMFKQWGEWLPGQNEMHPESWDGRRVAHHQDGSWGATETKVTSKNYVAWDSFGCIHRGCLIDKPLNFLIDAWAERVGKKAAGRLLDGREWNGVPS